MTESPLHVTGLCQENPVMYEAQDTSANKTHLFNWLYGAAVQMTPACGRVRDECVCAHRPCLNRVRFVHACGSLMCLCGWKLMNVPVIRFLTSLPPPERRMSSLISRRALLLLAMI